MNVSLSLSRFCIRFGPNQHLGRLLLSFFTSTSLTFARHRKSFLQSVCSEFVTAKIST